MITHRFLLAFKEISGKFLKGRHGLLSPDILRRLKASGKVTGSTMKRISDESLNFHGTFDYNTACTEDPSEIQLLGIAQQLFHLEVKTVQWIDACIQSAFSFEEILSFNSATSAPMRKDSLVAKLKKRGVEKRQVLPIQLVNVQGHEYWLLDFQRNNNRIREYFSTKEKAESAAKRHLQPVRAS
jgi:hypothetical protein